MWKNLGISKQRGNNIYKSICISLVYLHLRLLVETKSIVFFCISCVKSG